MVLLFYYIFLFGFIVYVFPLYHILYGLIAVFILKKPKAGLCLIIGGSILEQLLITAFIAENLNKALAFSGFSEASHAISAFI